MSKTEKKEIQTLTRDELVNKLSEQLIYPWNGGVVMKLAKELGYEVEMKHYHLWTLSE